MHDIGGEGAVLVLLVLGVGDCQGEIGVHLLVDGLHSLRWEAVVNRRLQHADRFLNFAHLDQQAAIADIGRAVSGIERDGLLESGDALFFAPVRQREHLSQVVQDGGGRLLLRRCLKQREQPPEAGWLDRAA